MKLNQDGRTRLIFKMRFRMLPLITYVYFNLYIGVRLSTELSIGVRLSAELNSPQTQHCIITLTECHGEILWEKYHINQGLVCRTNNNTKVENDLIALMDLMHLLNKDQCTIIVTLHHRNNWLQELLKDTHDVIPDYSHAQMGKLLESSTVISCQQVHHVYVEGITLLTEHLSVDLVSVITTDTKCNIEFAYMLTEQIKFRKGKGRVSVHHTKTYIMKTGDTPKDILLSTLEGRPHMRAVVLLTTPEVTLAFLEASAVMGMNHQSDFWIFKHFDYNPEFIPEQTATFSELKIKRYRPKRLTMNWSSNDQCSDRSSYLNMAINGESYVEKQMTAIKIWYRQQWQVIYQVTESEQIYSIQSFSSDFNILKTLRIGHSQKVRIVSVVEGPFLMVAHYLYDVNTTVCSIGTILCKQPNKRGNRTMWVNTCCYGYSVDLITHLSRMLGLQIHLYIVEDGKYGGYDKNTDSLNGMVGDVYTGKADMVVAGLTISSDRLKYIDFTVPFMISDIGIATLKMGASLNYLNTNFIENLGLSAFYGVATVFLLAIIIICSFDNMVLHYRRAYDKRFRGRSIVRMYSWRESFSYTCGLFFQRELGGLNPSTFSGRTTALVFAFSMVAFSTLYTASLTAERVVKVDNKDFKGLKDERMQHPTSDFKFATSAHTSIEAFFQKAPDPVLNRMYHFMLKYNVQNLEEGITKVLNKDLQAYMNEYPFLKYYIVKLSHCGIEIHENPIGQSSYGIATAKDSYLTELVSEAILHLQEDESLLKLQQKWLTNDCKIPKETDQFSLYFFSTPLLMLAIVIVLCMFILFGELATWRWFMRKQRGASINGSMRSYWKQVHNTSFNGMYENHCV